MATKAAKSKKTGSSKQPKPAPLYSNTTVRDCMTWHFQKGFTEEAPKSERPHFLPSKGAVGKPVSRGYEMDNVPAHTLAPHADDGTVIEALRGWPGTRRVEDGENDCGNANGNYGNLEAAQGTGDVKTDPWMGDLISHRFLTDSIRKRQEEEAQKDAAARAKRSAKGVSEAKLNRTSQLRAIALAEKVEVDPKDLWQMPRFKNKARAHLSTTEKKQKAPKGNDVTIRTQVEFQENGGMGGDPCVHDTGADNKYDDYFFDKNYKPSYEVDYTQQATEPLSTQDYRNNEVYAV